VRFSSKRADSSKGVGGTNTGGDRNNEEEEEENDRNPPCEGSACPNVTYTWYQGGFGACTKPCGGGEQIQVVECRNDKNVVVPDSFCTGTKPPSTRACNVQACTTTYAWNIGEYGECSKTCGGGTKTRTVVCQNAQGATVPDSNCPTPKPATSAPCNESPCPPDPTYDWAVTPGMCSKQCGGGTATDVVVCKREDGTTVADTFCASKPKPPTTRVCNTNPCPPNCTFDWETQPWTECSKTCGGGTQTRVIACKRSDGLYVDPFYCDASKKPITERACNTNACPTGKTETQELFVTPAMNSVDVIVVVDDSSSMKDDQKKLAKRMNGMLADLDALKVDYQLCLTTTDTSEFKGSPLRWTGYGNFILPKNVTTKNKIFLDSIDSLGAEWSNDERGILAVNLMIKNYSNVGCIRPQAALSVILVSDEDERSVGGIAGLSKYQYKPLEPMDMPDNLIETVRSTFNKPGFVKPFVWNSIIVKPGDKACEKAQDKNSSPSFPGVKYAQLSNKTNGHIGSICANDYTENLKFIKDRTVNSMPGMKLRCTPIGNPVVTFSPTVTTTVTVVGDELKFSPVIPEGVTIKAVYTCP